MPRRIKELHQCIVCRNWRPLRKLRQLDGLYICDEPTHMGDYLGPYDVLPFPPGHRPHVEMLLP